MLMVNTLVDAPKNVKTSLLFKLHKMLVTKIITAMVSLTAIKVSVVVILLVLLTVIGVINSDQVLQVLNPPTEKTHGLRVNVLIPPFAISLCHKVPT